MALQSYATEHNAIRGFRRQFAHLAHLSNDAIRMDVIDTGARLSVNLDAVAALEEDRFGELKTTRYEGIPALRRSVARKGATSKVKAFFSTLPAGTSRKDAIAAAVEAGFAYCTARTQYQIWKAA